MTMYNNSNERAAKRINNGNNDNNNKDLLYKEFDSFIVKVQNKSTLHHQIYVYCTSIMFHFPVPCMVSGHTIMIEF